MRKGKTLVKSIMTRSVKTITRKATVKEVVKKMVESDVGCMVVAEKKIPIGIFTRSDLLGVLASGLDLKKTPVESVMRTPVIPISEGDDYFSAARKMMRLDVRRFVIVDKAEKVTGVVTAMDLVKTFSLKSFSYKMSLAAVATDGLTVTPATPLKKVVRLMLDTRHNCVTVVKAGKPVGIVTERLITKLAASFNDPLKWKAGDKMWKKFVTANILSSLREAVIQMVKVNLRHIVCLDDSGDYRGAVSQRDLAAYIEDSQL